MFLKVKLGKLFSLEDLDKALALLLTNPGTVLLFPQLVVERLLYL